MDEEIDSALPFGAKGAAFNVRHYRWLIPLAGVFALALVVLVVYSNRAQLSRALIADSIFRKHIFTAPPRLQGVSRWRRLREEAQFFWDSSKIPIARERRLKLLDPLLRPMVKEIGVRQAAGEDVEYPMHIYREVRWRLNFTSDVAATEDRIADSAP